MSHYKPYPAYKDSGVEWLGRVPEHWSVKPLKLVAHVQTGIAKGKDNTGLKTIEVPYLRVANVQDGYLNLVDVATIEIPVDVLSRYLLQSGDVLMNEGGDFDKLGRGHVWSEEIKNCIHQNHVFAVRPHGVNPHWLNTFTGSAAAQFYFMCQSKQSTNLASISSSNLMELIIPLPPEAEVAQISSHLDRETTRIDTLIAKKSRFIELLKEKRQALITQAVTKGLNPNVKMKDSGVEWLGEVPEHWEVKSIGYVIDAVGDVDHFMPESVERGIPYLMTGDLKERVSLVELEKCKQVSCEDYLKLSRKIKCSMGDVILARYATIGTSMYVDIDIDFLVSYSCVTIKTAFSKVSGLYLFQYLKSDAFYQGIRNQINTNTQDNVGIDDLKKVKMALPSLTEQSKIIEFLNKNLKNIDSLTGTTQLSITLLKERRSALITAAVTGQIDLREAA